MMLLLPALLVLLAGCTDLPGGQQTQDEQPDVIQVDRPTCQVGGQRCSAGSVTRFAGTGEVRLALTNNGERPITVNVGQNGRQMMVSKCNDELVRIGSVTEGFRVLIQGPSEYTEETSFSPGGTIDVEENQRMTAIWPLTIEAGPDTLSRLGNSCQMDFEVSFDQTIETSRQVQIKQDRDVPDAASLDTTTTSKRPVRLRVEAPDSIVRAEGRNLVAEAFFENVGDGEITDVQRIEYMSGWDALFQCSPSNSDLRVYGEGPREGQSYRKSCSFPVGPDDDGPRSTVEWLRFEGDYSYRMSLGTETIELRPAPGEGG